VFWPFLFYVYEARLKAYRPNECNEFKFTIKSNLVLKAHGVLQRSKIAHNIKRTDGRTALQGNTHVAYQLHQRPSAANGAPGVAVPCDVISSYSSVSSFFFVFFSFFIPLTSTFILAFLLSLLHSLFCSILDHFFDS
jgi:hypothetical protein